MLMLSWTSNKINDCTFLALRGQFGVGGHENSRRNQGIRRTGRELPSLFSIYFLKYLNMKIRFFISPLWTLLKEHEKQKKFEHLHHRCEVSQIDSQMCFTLIFYSHYVEKVWCLFDLDLKILYWSNWAVSSLRLLIWVSQQIRFLALLSILVFRCPNFRQFYSFTIIVTLTSWGLVLHFRLPNRIERCAKEAVWWLP